MEIIEKLIPSPDAPRVRVLLLLSEDLPSACRTRILRAEERLFLFAEDTLLPALLSLGIESSPPMLLSVRYHMKKKKEKRCCLLITYEAFLRGKRILLKKTTRDMDAESGCYLTGEQKLREKRSRKKGKTPRRIPGEGRS